MAAFQLQTDCKFDQETHSERNRVARVLERKPELHGATREWQQAVGERTPSYCMCFLEWLDAKAQEST